jgi:hypothetical protein
MDDSREAAERASILLEANWKLSNGEHHPLDAPSFSIERLLTDLMHYSHSRNKGITDDSGEYLHFDRMVKDAREQFIKEREATPELFEPLLDPNRPQRDPEFDAMQDKLYSRQLAETLELERKHETELNSLGPSKELSDRHREERNNQIKNFDEERERYILEYHDAKRIAQEMEQQEKQKTLDLDPAKKLSR